MVAFQMGLERCLRSKFVMLQIAIDSLGGLVYTYSLFLFRGVAQLASALALGAKGRRFESDRPDHWWQR